MSITAKLNTVRLALENGDFQRSLLASAEAVKTAPDDPEAHFLRAMALAAVGQVVLALDALDKSIQVNPRAAAYHAQKARLLMYLRKQQEARSAANCAVELSSEADAWTLDTVGCVYALLGDHEAAIPLFRMAVSKNQESAPYRFNLATSLSFFGQADAAALEFEAALRLSPHHGRAHLGLASLRTQTPQSNHLEQLESALLTARDPIERVRIHYAAAKELDDLGDYQASYKHLSTANRQYKAATNFKIAEVKLTSETLLRSFRDPGYFCGPSTQTDPVIFVTGLPRSGTTLVDTILSAHPDVSSGGELHAMSHAVKSALGRRISSLIDAETIEGARHLHPDDIGRKYLQEARKHAGTRSPFFTDKLPLNFFFLGYIARSMPNASIVCLRRNPMDTVWAIYKNLFSTASRNYDWTYDLLDIAEYYVLFDQLISFWSDVFPGRIYQLKYETLVADHEAEARRLLAHCGVPWSDQCLRFYETAAAISTPSAQQVRQPINAASLGKWRCYEPHLVTVRRFFEDRGIAID